MEFCSGGSCSDLMRPGLIPEEYIMIILRELLMGLDYLHCDKKLHRDVKGKKEVDIQLYVPRQVENTLTLYSNSCECTSRCQWTGQTCRFRCLRAAVGHHD
jgi:serine/threonine protein kinase